MTQLSKISDLKPASFESSQVRLTYGQINILKLLQERLNENKSVSKDDILNCYCDSMEKFGGDYGVSYWNSIERQHVTTNKKTHLEYVRNHAWDRYMKSRTWFSHNLGSCILKGKLLAIPVIEIE